MKSPGAQDFLEGTSGARFTVGNRTGRQELLLCRGDRAPLNSSGHQLFPVGVSTTHDAADASSSEAPTKKSECLGCEGLTLKKVGPLIYQRLLEACPLRSQSKGNRRSCKLFPLPTSHDLLSRLYPALTVDEVSWLASMCVALNSLWGGDLFFEGEVSNVSQRVLEHLCEDVMRLRSLGGVMEGFEWSTFFSTRSIDYKGDEVKIARHFEWANLKPALPEEIGRVPLEAVCTLGAKHYVQNFRSYLKDPSMWDLKKPPRVMCEDQHWPDVCTGLVQAGVCGFIPSEEVFQTGSGPLLNGLFGVSKDEWCDGHEVFRLIMNLVPLNEIMEPLQGDVGTLPMWSLMTPFQLHAGESLLVSSEDVRCFFYTMAVPDHWLPFLAFNKLVPDCCLPSHLKGQEVYLTSRVLPMGFLNSVSLAQHVHRNLALWSGEESGCDDCNKPELEIRKDKAPPTGNPQWRIYLDNYDLLERVPTDQVEGLQGTVASSVQALRSMYDEWEVPRNLKKAVSRGSLVEVQGAQVDGQRGIAYPREVKLLKYAGAVLLLLTQAKVTQKQLQVVCGGLVYFTMFRRQLLGCLNAVWHFIESFNNSSVATKPLPAQCRFEIVRLLALVPLARMNFRLPYHELVSCSDASSTGGGVCVSRGLTSLGGLVACGTLRGQLPVPRSEHRVLTIGLFDGIAALRVAADLIGLESCGHISVECNEAASRVVESHFPDVLVIKDVKLVTESVVRSWSLKYSQAALVIVAGGPPCQGVSGLNSDRKGALKDLRSCLFVHVSRILELVRREFPWAQVQGLMESVQSMDPVDRQMMSSSFGSQPWACGRPRLYWITWQLSSQAGAELVAPDSSNYGTITLTAWQDLDEVCEEGWTKVDPSRPFPTFTTSRPRPSPGRKPAGLQQCTNQEVDRWQQDQHRFPPYQYASRNCLINGNNSIRLPSVREKEYMLGFPVNYTAGCFPKSKRKTQEAEDERHTLLGNTWSVPVVAWLLSQLTAPLDLSPTLTPQQIVDKLRPQAQDPVRTALWRSPLRPIRGAAGPAPAVSLVQKLGTLISVKGEDLLLTSSSNELCKFHRLRSSVPGKLWKWKIVTGWRWANRKEHINGLELRAALTALKWRIVHQQHLKCRFIHLTDSLVALHCLSRGRSSSRRLRLRAQRLTVRALSGAALDYGELLQGRVARGSAEAIFNAEEFGDFLIYPQVVSKNMVWWLVRLHFLVIFVVCVCLLACFLPCFACFALPCFALPCFALPCFALLCFALLCIALHWIALHCIGLHWIALHCIALLAGWLACFFAFSFGAD
eukprot:Skav219710  [mRNA]  locus=scaffold776:167537:175718:- [translate_table: standard]